MFAAVAFAACSSDSDGDSSSSSDYDYISVTIEGKKGREEFAKGFNIDMCGDGKDGKEMITLHRQTLYVVHPLLGIEVVRYCHYAFTIPL